MGVAFVAALPFFLASYGQSLAFDLGAMDSTQGYGAYLVAKHVVICIGCASGVLIAKTVLIVHYLHKDNR